MRARHAERRNGVDDSVRQALHGIVQSLQDGGNGGGGSLNDMEGQPDDALAAFWQDKTKAAYDTFVQKRDTLVPDAQLRSELPSCVAPAAATIAGFRASAGVQTAWRTLAAANESKQNATRLAAAARESALRATVEREARAVAERKAQAAAQAREAAECKAQAAAQAQLRAEAMRKEAERKAAEERERAEQQRRAAAREHAAAELRRQEEVRNVEYCFCEMPVCVVQHAPPVSRRRACACRRHRSVLQWSQHRMQLL